MTAKRGAVVTLAAGLALLLAAAFAWHGLRNHMMVTRLSIVESATDVVTDTQGACAGVPPGLHNAFALLKGGAVLSTRISYAAVPARDFTEANAVIAGGDAVAPQTLQLSLLCRLQAAGFDARFVSAITTPLTSQHLDFIEAKLDGHWVLLDPVLDAVVQDRKGRLLGDADIRRALYDGKFRDIGYRSFAPRAAGMEASGNSQLHKFHYGVIATRLFGLGVLERVPPLRFLTGARGVIDRGLLDGHNEDISLQQWLYAFVVLILPLMGCILMAAGILAAARGWGKQ
jgi:hypothetical protein